MIFQGNRVVKVKYYEPFGQVVCGVTFGAIFWLNGWRKRIYIYMDIFIIFIFPDFFFASHSLRFSNGEFTESPAGNILTLVEDC